MQIRFISGLTAEEENQFAPPLLRAITTILVSSLSPTRCGLRHQATRSTSTASLRSR
jgi:hypothetical protein